MDADHKRRSQEGLSKRMREDAEHRRCPECQRKAALTRHRIGPTSFLRVCRWCGYERISEP